MIDRPTTLLLGAGASQHLRYPLGYQLRNAILLDLKHRLEKEPNHDEQDFYLGLSRGGFASPDAYLEHNPQHLTIGKQCIARALKKHEEEDRLFPPHSPGWYEFLFARLLTPTLDEFVSNRLSVVTFNYDRSLECFLHRSIQYRYRTDERTAWEILIAAIPVVHVHGILGDYPSIPYQASPEENERISSQVTIIHEIADRDGDFCTPEFRRANELLQRAEVIHSLGFSFADANVRRLAFFSDANLKTKQFNAACGSTMGTIAMEDLVKRLQPFGITRANLHPRNCEEYFTHAVRL